MPYRSRCQSDRFRKRAAKRVNKAAKKETYDRLSTLLFLQQCNKKGYATVFQTRLLPHSDEMRKRFKMKTAAVSDPLGGKSPGGDACRKYQINEALFDIRKDRVPVRDPQQKRRRPDRRDSAGIGHIGFSAPVPRVYHCIIGIKHPGRYGSIQSTPGP